jgi:hypothetical protein
VIWQKCAHILLEPVASIQETLQIEAKILRNRSFFLKFYRTSHSKERVPDSHFRENLSCHLTLIYDRCYCTTGMEQDFTNQFHSVGIMIKLHMAPALEEWLVTSVSAGWDEQTYYKM